ncbi:hypothetical protein KKE34_03595 [Patescibacteria group bacterium]|nr:hypothetical protein [Patescibacteria group bacterium]MBU1885666.1 hypothetical protein [Patescibacteria group bacterium]
MKKIIPSKLYTKTGTFFVVAYLIFVVLLTYSFFTCEEMGCFFSLLLWMPWIQDPVFHFLNNLTGSSVYMEIIAAVINTILNIAILYIIGGLLEALVTKLRATTQNLR